MEALWLVHNGVPFEVAFKMGELDRAAFAIIFSQFQGGEFDWDRMAFKEPPK